MAHYWLHLRGGVCGVGVSNLADRAASYDQRRAIMEIVFFDLLVCGQVGGVCDVPELALDPPPNHPDLKLEVVMAK